MSQGCKRYEHHQETAEAHRTAKLESHQRFIAKGKGRDWGPTVPSVAGPSNTVGKPRRSPVLPGAVRVMLSRCSSPPWLHLPTSKLYLHRLHNHFSNSSGSRPFGISLLAVFHFLEAPKFLCPVGFSINFLIFRVSGLSSPSHITLDR